MTITPNFNDLSLSKRNREPFCFHIRLISTKVKNHYAGENMRLFIIIISLLITSCLPLDTPPNKKCTKGQSKSQSCSIANGEGEQSRVCADKTWTPYGTCAVTKCNSGYELKSGLCEIVLPVIMDNPISRFGFLSAHGQQLNTLFAKWDQSESINLNLINESQKHVLDLNVGWSREITLIYTASSSPMVTLYANERIIAAKSANLKIVATVGIDETIFDNNKSGYGSWLTSLVSLYKNDVEYWQIHNEVGQQGRFENVANYIALLKFSYEKIKQTCSNCKVMMGSTIPNLPYLVSMVADGDSFVDSYDFHLFGDINSHLGIFTSFVQHLKGKNISKPIFVTEMATYSGQPIGANLLEHTEEFQAAELIKMFTRTFYAGADYIFWAQLIEWYKFAGKVDGFFDFTGLVYNGLCSSVSTADICQDQSIDKGANVKKEAYYALKTLISKIDKFGSIQKIAEGQYKFFVNNKNVWILWCDQAVCHLPLTGSFIVTDYQGNVSISDASLIKLSTTPIFVEKNLSPI